MECNDRKILGTPVVSVSSHRDLPAPAVLPEDRREQQHERDLVPAGDLRSVYLHPSAYRNGECGSGILHPHIDDLSLLSVPGMGYQQRETEHLKAGRSYSVCGRNPASDHCCSIPLHERGRGTGKASELFFGFCDPAVHGPVCLAETGSELRRFGHVREEDPTKY